jgi:hypothetical protein
MEPTCTISHQSPMVTANKESCIECFRLLHNHLKVLFDQPGFLGGYEHAFITLFGQDVETFTITMALYLDQLQQQLENDEFSEESSMATFSVIYKQLHVFFYSKFT